MQIPLDAHLKNRCTAVYCVQNRFVRLSVKPKYKLPKKTIQALVIASQSHCVTADLSSMAFTT